MPAQATRAGRLVRLVLAACSLAAPTAVWGQVSEIIDQSGDGFSAFDGPTAESVAVDAAGNVYVTAERTNNAFQITPGGTVTQIISSSGDAAGNSLGSPQGIAVGPSGAVYVAGGVSDNVFEIAPDRLVPPREIIDATGDGAGHPLAAPIGIAVDAAGNVYVAGFGSDNVFKVTPAGVATQLIDRNGDRAGHTLSRPVDVAVDRLGNVYVSGSRSHNVFRITPGGAISQIIDGSGDGSGNPLISPRAIAAGGDGRIHVAGSISSNVFRIEPACGNGLIDAGESCDDGNISGGDCCSALCQYEPAGASCGDLTASACDAADTCDGAGTCAPNPVAAGAPCGDQGVACRVDDACDGAGACTDNGFASAGTACGDPSTSACDDADRCDGAGTCDANLRPAGTSCDDGNPCTENDACSSGACQPGSAVVCDDGDRCTADTCDPGSGCVYSGISLSLDDCETGFQKTLVSVKETTPGKEKLTIKLLRGPDLAQPDLGDPLAAGGTAYSVCLFDDTGALAGSLVVDAAGGDCGGTPCWKSLGGAPPDGKGYLYKDKAAAADGVTLVKMKAGAVGKSRLQATARNDAAKGLSALPVGIAAALQHSRAAVVAVLGDGGECFAGAANHVKQQDGTKFKALGGAPCGDGAIDLLEECDGADLDGVECTDLGFASGALACGEGCIYDTAGCDDGTRRVFVTSTDTNGNIGGLAGGDAMCQARADAAGLGGTWTAWLSDASTDARDRITDARYVRIDGVVVAESLADLTDGTLEAPIRITEMGTPRDLNGRNLAWTGTSNDGRGSNHCGSWTVDDVVTYGMSGNYTSQANWTGQSNEWCSLGYPVYCFED